MKRQVVFDFLAEQGIPYRLQEHEAVFRVAESSKVLPEKVPVKTLLLREDKGDRVCMVAMRGDVRLDVNALAKSLGVKRLQFVKAEAVEPLVGVKPGSVSLFGLLDPGAQAVEVVLDAALMDEAELGFHPNDNTATVYISPADAIRVVEETGHNLHTIAL